MEAVQACVGVWAISSPGLDPRWDVRSSRGSDGVDALRVRVV